MEQNLKPNSVPWKPAESLGWIIFVIAIISAVGRGQAPASAQESSQEEVTVTVVEVPVRVLLKGRAVRDLTKDDFEVYENGVRQDITQFEIIR